jgi:hypothetical protein
MVQYFTGSKLHMVYYIPGIHSPGACINAFPAKPATENRFQYFFLNTPACEKNQFSQAVIG